MGVVDAATPPDQTGQEDQSIFLGAPFGSSASSIADDPSQTIVYLPIGQDTDFECFGGAGAACIDLFLAFGTDDPPAVVGKK